MTIYDVYARKLTATGETLRPVSPVSLGDRIKASRKLIKIASDELAKGDWGRMHENGKVSNDSNGFFARFNFLLVPHEINKGIDWRTIDYLTANKLGARNAIVDVTLLFDGRFEEFVSITPARKGPNQNYRNPGKPIFKWPEPSIRRR